MGRLAGLAPAPLAWLVVIGIGWALVPVACSGTELLLHALLALAAAAAAAGLAVSLRAVRDRDGWSDDGAEQGGFLASMGVLLSGVFLAGIVIAWTFTVALDACW